jgi:hypothetical protein
MMTLKHFYVYVCSSYGERKETFSSSPYFNHNITKKHNWTTYIHAHDAAIFFFFLCCPKKKEGKNFMKIYFRSRSPLTIMLCIVYGYVQHKNSSFSQWEQNILFYMYIICELRFDISTDFFYCSFCYWSWWWWWWWKKIEKWMNKNGASKHKFLHGTEEN